MDKVKIDLDFILENSAVETEKDHLELFRNFSNIPRCHILNVSKRISVAEHSMNCMLLLYHFNANGRIGPKLDKEELRASAEYLFSHDFRELLVGDIPYLTAKFMDDSEIQRYLCDTLEIDSDGDGVDQNLMNFFDLLEFVLDIKSDPNFGTKRLQSAYNNALINLKKLSNQSEYCINYLDLLVL